MQHNSTSASDVCVCAIRFGHLTVAIGDGGGVALALALLHGGGSEGLCALARRLPGVRQTLHRPHLLAQAALRRTLRHKNTSHLVSVQEQVQPVETDIQQGK